MILGTAGHIDHGKTSLVKALTGVDTDRLPEEKRRGITIALGFAPLELAGVGRIGVVDVPGHEAFVRTMVAGATGVDLALLVIAADEGVMPQTREHLDVLALLGVQRGVVALTKADLVDVAALARVTGEVDVTLASSVLAGAATIPVSVVDGRGLDELRAQLTRVAGAVEQRAVDDLFRLPIDRAFSVAGAGTVVTGTAWSGAVRVGDTVRILPMGTKARVRSIETHGAKAEQGIAGARVALALAGVDRAQVGPGATVVRDGDPWEPTRVLRADVRWLAGAAIAGRHATVRLHHGTTEVSARVSVASTEVANGAARPARLILDAPIVARAGDRFVLRGGPHGRTLGGGTITDPSPARTRLKPWPDTAPGPLERLGWIVDEAGPAGVSTRSLSVRLGIRPALAERLARELPHAALIGDVLVADGVLARGRASLLAAVERTHAADPLARGLELQTARAAVGTATAVADEVIRRAARAALIEVDGAWVRSPGFTPGAAADHLDAKERVFAALEAAGTEPPSVAELVTTFGPDAHALLKLLGRDGRAVAVSMDRWWSRRGLDVLLGRLHDQVRPGRVYAPSELRDMLGVSRKYLIPFLEWCDRERISDRGETGRTFRGIPTP